MSAGHISVILGSQVITSRFQVDVLYSSGRFQFTFCKFVRAGTLPFPFLPIPPSPPIHHNPPMLQINKPDIEFQQKNR